MTPFSSALAYATTALVLLAACSDQPRPLPTLPASGPTRSLSGADPCSKADAQYLSGELKNVFAQSIRQQAGVLERAVENTCPSTAPSTAPMLDLVAQILEWRKTAGLIIADDTALWAYLTTLFHYDGYAIDNLGGSAALGAEGFIKICDERSGITGTGGYETSGGSTYCQATSAKKTSAVRLYKGALNGGRYLITGAPLSCTNATRSLSSATQYVKVYGQCVDISIDPKSTSKFDLTAVTGQTFPAIVQTCLVESAPTYLLSTSTDPFKRPGRLSQLSGTDSYATVRTPAPAIISRTSPEEAGTGCDYATLVAQAGGWGDAARGLVLAGLTRAFGLLAPPLAYAAHSQSGDVSGGTGFFSIFGPADSYLFDGDFTVPPNVYGEPPKTYSALRGSFVSVTNNPGEIAVRSGLGDIASDLVVINQAGGNAAQKYGLALVAKLGTKTAGVYPTTGKWRVTWRSLINSTRAFTSPLVLRSAVANDSFPTNAPDQQSEIVRFAYVDGSNAMSGPIYFGTSSTTATATGLTWQSNVSQRFYVTLDLSAHKAYFGLLNATSGLPDAPVAQVTIPAGVNFGRFAWELTGKDGQIIGTDDMRAAALGADTAY